MTRWHMGLVVGLAILCAGCPATLKPEAMQTSIPQVQHRSAGDLLVVAIGATGVTKTKPIRVTDEGFAQALAVSLEHAGLFRHVGRDAASLYQLQATIQSVDEDLFGFNMTASIDVHYALARMSPKGLVWEQRIHTAHTAGISDSVFSMPRLQMATEGAVRKNIEQAIQEIARLRLE